jgi:hypothetical protein
LPFVLEVWAEVADRQDFAVSINRTPATAEVNAYHDIKEGRLSAYGCGLKHSFKVGRRPMRIHLNVDTPHMPIITDGKAPDLRPLLPPIAGLMEKVARRARDRAKALHPAGPASVSQKDAILECLDRAIAKAGDDGAYRFSLRQLFYAVRPYVIEAVGKELEYGTFTKVITAYEAERGADIPGIYRDARGTLYHPHIGATIALGTLGVESYRRPGWTFNKILYCEKEGFHPILIAAGWPERHDCALLTSKGYASRAARDVLDLLGDTDEDLHFFCIHDADAYGTMIYQALQEGTEARARRRVEIHRLGLEPAEAMEMDLQVEEVVRKPDAPAAPVADYVEEPWRGWFQTKRIELNAMTTPQFLEWLDRKFADLVGKVVPPADVIADRLQGEVRSEVERRITARVLQEARIDERAERELRRLGPAIGARSETIASDVRRYLDQHRECPWGDPVAAAARAIAAADGECGAA